MIYRTEPGRRGQLCLQTANDKSFSFRLKERWTNWRQQGFWSYSRLAINCRAGFFKQYNERPTAAGVYRVREVALAKANMSSRTIRHVEMS